MDGKKHAARRTDGDGNGFLTDPQDRLWIDLNDDGRWDSSDEQFLYSTILIVGSSRYAAAFRRAWYAIGARACRRNRDRAAQPESARGFSARNRTARDLDRPRRVSRGNLPARQRERPFPPGNTASIRSPLPLTIPTAGRRWSFIFSDDGGTHDYKWYRVAKNGTVEIDPVGKLVLQTGVQDKSQLRLRRAMISTFSPGSLPAAAS